LEASLSYTVSSRSAVAIQQDSVSKKKNKEIKLKIEGADRIPKDKNSLFI
jgi:hypothetical protein